MSLWTRLGLEAVHQTGDLAFLRLRGNLSRDGDTRTVALGLGLGAAARSPEGRSWNSPVTDSFL